MRFVNGWMGEMSASPNTVQQIRQACQGGRSRLRRRCAKGRLSAPTNARDSGRPTPCPASTAPVDGVRFDSRHGNDRRMRALYERLGDDPLPGLMRNDRTALVDAECPVHSGCTRPVSLSTTGSNLRLPLSLERVLGGQCVGRPPAPAVSVHDEGVMSDEFGRTDYDD